MFSCVAFYVLWNWIRWRNSSWSRWEGWRGGLLRLSSESWKHSVAENECSRAEKSQIFQSCKHIELWIWLRWVAYTFAYPQPVKEVKSEDRSDGDVEGQEGAFHSSKINTKSRPDNNKSDKRKSAEASEDEWDHNWRSSFRLSESMMNLSWWVVLNCDRKGE